MYIPEFWCGVAVTIAAEIVGLIIAGFWSSANGKK